MRSPRFRPQQPVRLRVASSSGILVQPHRRQRLHRSAGFARSLRMNGLCPPLGEQALPNARRPNPRRRCTTGLAAQLPQVDLPLAVLLDDRICSQSRFACIEFGSPILQLLVQVDQVILLPLLLRLSVRHLPVSSLWPARRIIGRQRWRIVLFIGGRDRRTPGPPSPAVDNDGAIGGIDARWVRQGHERGSLWNCGVVFAALSGSECPICNREKRFLPVCGKKQNE